MNDGTSYGAAAAERPCAPSSPPARERPRSHWLLLFGALWLATLGTYVAGVIHLEREARLGNEKHIFSSQSVQVQLAAEGISMQIDRVLSRDEHLAGQAIPAAFRAPDVDRRLAALVQPNLASAPEALAYVLAEPAGGVIAESAPVTPAVRRATRQAMAWLKSGAAGSGTSPGGWRTTPFAIDPKAQLLGFRFTVDTPVYGDAVLLAVVDLAPLIRRYVGPLGRDPSSTGYVLTDDGRLVFGGTAAAIGRDVVAGNQSGRRLAVDRRMLEAANGSGGLDIASPDGKSMRRLVTWRHVPIGRRGLVVVLAASADELNRFLAGLRTQHILMGVFLFVAFLASGMLFLRYRQQMLVRTSRQLRQRVDARTRELAHELAERSRAEQALAMSEERFRTLVESTDVVAWEMDLGSHRFTYVSPHATKLLGYPIETWYEPGFWERHVHPDDREPTLTDCREASRRGEDHDFEYRMIAADGHFVWVRDIISAHAEGGRPAMLYGFLIDISHLKEVEQQIVAAKEDAEIASRSKSEFLANMSHELRTPLNSIIGFSDIVKHEIYGSLGDPRYREYVEDINDAGRHLLAVINDLLDISRVEAGHAKLAEKPVDLGLLLRSCLRMCGERAASGSIDLTQEMDGDVPPVQADERRLRQVFLNLLSNALKFTPPGGRVTVGGWRRDDGGISVHVSDTGIGIAEDDLPRVLERFGQASAGLTRHFEGAGLGLTLAKLLVEMHGGRLEVDSTAGVGTQVTVHLPAERTLVG